MSLINEKHPFGSQNALPLFLIIGAQKAGTTALHAYLTQHPRIKSASVKEIHFFNSQKRYSMGYSFYHSHFDVNKGFIYVDASPSYFATPEACQRIYKYNPKIKLVALVRNPVERAFSAWNMYRTLHLENCDWFFDYWLPIVGRSAELYRRRTSQEFEDFSLFVQNEIEHQKCSMNGFIETPVLPQGLYSLHLNRFYEYFDKSQILVIESNHLKDKPIENLAMIERFLGIELCNWEEMDLSPVFEGGYSSVIPEPALSKLSEFYAPHNDRLYELIGRQFSW